MKENKKEFNPDPLIARLFLGFHYAVGDCVRAGSNPIMLFACMANELGKMKATMELAARGIVPDNLLTPEALDKIIADNIKRGYDDKMAHAEAVKRGVN